MKVSFSLCYRSFRGRKVVMLLLDYMRHNTGLKGTHGTLLCPLMLFFGFLTLEGPLKLLSQRTHSLSRIIPA
jgi:hypothetical protein